MRKMYGIIIYLFIDLLTVVVIGYEIGCFGADLDCDLVGFVDVVERDLI